MILSSAFSLFAFCILAFFSDALRVTFSLSDFLLVSFVRTKSYLTCHVVTKGIKGDCNHFIELQCETLSTVVDAAWSFAAGLCRLCWFVRSFQYTDALYRACGFFSHMCKTVESGEVESSALPNAKKTIIILNCIRCVKARMKRGFCIRLYTVVYKG